ncbi:hypothetical protein Pan44_08750 [Caulifigura coniformis]|uniref:BBC1/AIM3 cysteine proteinase-fold domain-containing protein n=1 Tax=Caulifigura coniformis TaxID=2527983 RepID=A0A517S9S4_9PLAN|nr:hypothetical protein [Caulifigura coniformis]QDT52862.1 hypothetical protein Pan44_08750 [Caulifigura coniformis]
MRLAVLVTAAILVYSWSSASAEYPALEKGIAPAIEEPARLIGDQVVHVGVRNLTGLTPPWKLPEAIQSELVAGLAGAKVKAINAGDDNLLAFLGQGTAAFSSKDQERARRAVPEGFLLLGELRRSGQAPALSLTLWNAQGEKAWAKEFPLESAALAVAPNIPVLNQEVVAAAAGKSGQWVGNKSSWGFVAETLKEVGAVRSGLYGFGRELGRGEPWAPGDVLQFVGVRFKEEKSKRYSNLTRHTAIVEKVNSPIEIEILHQNFNDQPVARRKLRFDELQKGYLVAFRPTKDESQVGLARARRVRAPEPDTQSDGSVNLLTMIDPQIDALRGIWHRSDGPLESFKQSFGGIQIPYDLPDAYTLTIRAKRVSGTDSFGLGLKVGDSRAFLVLDAYDGVTGFHLMNGKRANQNPSTRKGRVLEPDQVVELVCQVTPQSVSLKADGKELVDWKGDPSVFKVDEKWKTPEKPWLFLTAHESIIEITRIKLSSP